MSKTTLLMFTSALGYFEHVSYWLSCMLCTVTTSGLCLGSWKRTSELHMEVTMTLSTQMGELVATPPCAVTKGLATTPGGDLRLKLVSWC